MPNISTNPLDDNSYTNEGKYYLKGSEIKHLFKNFLSKYVTQLAMDKLIPDIEYASLTEYLKDVRKYEPNPWIADTLLAYSNRGLSLYFVHSDTYTELHEMEVNFLFIAVTKYHNGLGSVLDFSQLSDTKMSIKPKAGNRELLLRHYLVDYLNLITLMQFGPVNIIKQTVVNILNNITNFSDSLIVENEYSEERALYSPFEYRQGIHLIINAMKRAITLLKERGLDFKETLPVQSELHDTYSTALTTHFEITDTKGNLNFEDEVKRTKWIMGRRSAIYTPSYEYGGITLLPAILIANSVLMLEIPESKIIELIFNRANSNLGVATKVIESEYLINDLLIELIDTSTNDNLEFMKKYLQACKEFQAFGLNSIPYL